MNGEVNDETQQQLSEIKGVQKRRGIPWWFDASLAAIEHA